MDVNSFVCFDTETIKIAPGRLAPRVVCSSAAVIDQARITGFIFNQVETFEFAKLLLGNGGVFVNRLGQQITIPGNPIIVGMNVAFDLACLAAADESFLPLVFQAFDDGRVYDIAIAMQLDAIAGGYIGFDPRHPKPDDTLPELKDPTTRKRARYNLNVCCDLVLGRTDAKKNDVFRKSYAILDGTPIEEWPEAARTYPVDDAVNTLEVALRQLAGWTRGVADTYTGPVRNLGNMREQVLAAFCLHLGACWGLMTDARRVWALASAVEERHQRMVERFQKLGWIRSPCEKRCGACSTCKDAGKENSVAVKRAIATAYGASGSCPRCGGVGRIVPIKQKTCRGEKLSESRNGKRKGSYKGCLGVGCKVCGGAGEVNYEGEESTCKAQDGGCDGTGYDLTTASMLPRTDKGGIKTDRDASMESGDDDLYDFSDNVYEKIRLTYVPYLRTGYDRPLKFSPNVLVASGRGSYDGSPIHQFSRKGLCDESGKLIMFEGYPLGTRECVVARPGRVLCSTDYASGELDTLAQICLWVVGHSRMAEIINETKDPGSLHTYLGSKMLGISFEEMKKRVKAKDSQAKDFRQSAKCSDFGYPGMLGSPTLVIQNRRLAAGTTMLPGGQEVPGIRFCVLLDGQRQCGVEKITKWGNRDITPVCKRCVEVAEEVLKPAFFNTYPEVREYLNWIVSHLEENDGVIEQIVWNQQIQKVQIVRKRGGCTPAASANTMFQGLLADIFKLAYSTMTREAYLGVKQDGSPSPLAGARFPLGLHDEPLAELDEETAHLSAPRISEIMEEAGRTYAPDVFWRAEPAISKIWTKGMEPRYNDRKELIVWTP